MKTVIVRYYAVFREAAGISVERIETNSDNLAGFYSELSERHGFVLATDRLRVAVNDEFSDWASLLRDGDTVVFIPPVAGG